MVEVEQALSLVNKYIQASKLEHSLCLKDALGLTLAKNVNSTVDLPPFNQSAMDGYAIRYHDKNANDTKFKLCGEARAGTSEAHKLKAGEAFRVFTGAPIPKMTDAVIMQEHIKVDINSNIIQYKHDKLPLKGINIRKKGCNTQKGEVLLQKNHVLDASSIGYLATTGISDVYVYKKPSIALITTGNELAEAGKPLLPGQIYESNNITIVSALKSEGHSADSYSLKDSYDKTKKLLEKVIKDYTFIITTGGISVGDYDYIRQVLESLKVKQIFYKVKQKPGKPLFFGTSNGSYIFALPGNPSSALTCFYLYVVFALNKFMHKQTIFSWKKCFLSHDAQNDNNRTLLLKAVVDDYQNVTVNRNQKSDCLGGFATSNAMVLFSPNSNYKKGDEMNYILYKR